MKKSIGSQLTLYPMPIGVIGTKVNGKNNFVLAAHFGIVSHQHLLVSLSKTHYTNQGIKENKALTINLVDENMIAKADYVGSVSGNKVDKSNVFQTFEKETKMPIIEESPLTIECEVIDNYSIAGFDNFICTIKNVYVKEEYLDEKNKINYEKLKPILFEFPTYQYLKTGEVLGKCLSFKEKMEEN